MRYQFDIWNCLCKIADCFVMAYVPFRLFSLRHFVKHRKIVLLLSLLVLSIITYGADFAFYRVPLIVTLLLYLSLGIFYVCTLFYGQITFKIIVLGASISTSILMRFATGVLLNLILKDVKVFSFEMTMGSSVLLLLLTLYFIHFAVIPKTQLNPWYSIGMAVFMLMMALMSEYILSWAVSSSDWVFSLWLFIFPVGVILFLYFLFFRLVREFEEKSTNKLRETQQKHLQESMQVYNDMRYLRHEIKNHVFYMQTLLKQKKLVDLEEYFHTVYRQEYDIDLIDSGNNAINALLSQKTMFAKNKGIHISIESSLPEALPIDEGSLCAVISNIFDNAIEACEKLSEPTIIFAIHQTRNHVHILCKNSVSFDICKENPTMQTTKLSGVHGIGLQVVQRIVEEHDGMIDFHMEDMAFVVTLMLKF